jgi:rSAM/selenodomain-associated transferase 2
MLSIIIPTLNEAANIQTTLLPLQAPRIQGHEVIIVDGRSNDNTVPLASDLADRCLLTTPGRAQQMNHGAKNTNGDILLFLHADSRLPDNATMLIEQAISNGAVWGRFDIQLSGKHPMFYIIATLMNLRSHLSGIATGDQGIFVRRDVFESVGGYPEIHLMEDIALCRKLRRRHRPACLSAKIRTSSRRWEKHGVFKTILLMWCLRLAYFLGADPDRLAQHYYDLR